MVKTRAFYGDVHGCIDELLLLYHLVRSLFPDAEHWHLGDLVDRGPDSGRVVRFARKYFDGGIIGNHERSIIKLWNRMLKKGMFPSNPDKERTIQQLKQEDVDYLKSLPFLHVFDDIKTVICHGGLYPKIPLAYQTEMIGVTNNQMIRANAVVTKDLKGKIHYTPEDRRWFGGEAHQQPNVWKTEEQSKQEGFARWYELYDHDYDCLYGHSVLDISPFIHQNKGAGRTIGIDTGSCFGGYITALILPQNVYVRVPCKEYVEGKNVKKFKGISKE